MKIVVNRAGLETGAISIKKAQETMGRDVFWQIPNDYRVMTEVRNHGVPLVDHAPTARITQSVVSLAAHLSGEPKSEEVQNTATGLSRWFSFWPGAKASPAFVAKTE